MKGLAWQDGYQTAWEILERDNPDAVANSSNLYQCWEVPDPEKWIPNGYALVRVDSRGAGRSAGFLAVSSPQETQSAPPPGSRSEEHTSELPSHFNIPCPLLL